MKEADVRGGGYDPYRKPNGFEKVNPTPGTTRNRIVGKNGWRTFEVVPNALTKFGEQFMIRLPARRSAS